MQYDIDPVRDGNRWVWPDGTTLPVVSGGSDLSDVGAPPPAADAPTADATADAPAADAPPADAPAGDDDFYAGWPEPAVQAHKDLKAENVKYKERFRPFEQTFGALHEDDAEFFRGFIDAVREQDTTALAEYATPLRALLDKMTPAEQRAVAKAVDAATPDGAEEFDPFDPKQIEKLAEEKARALFAERDAQEAERRQAEQHAAAVAKATEEITSAAKVASDEHGIPEWSDPTSGLYAALVSVAHRSFPKEMPINERIAKAAEALRGDFDRRGQELLKAKSAGAGDKPAPQGGEQPSGQKVPTTLAEASESAMRRLEGFSRGPG